MSVVKGGLRDARHSATALQCLHATFDCVCGCRAVGRSGMRQRRRLRPGLFEDHSGPVSDRGGATQSGGRTAFRGIPANRKRDGAADGHRAVAKREGSGQIAAPVLRSGERAGRLFRNAGRGQRPGDRHAPVESGRPQDHRGRVGALAEGRSGPGSARRRAGECRVQQYGLPDRARSRRARGSESRAGFPRGPGGHRQQLFRRAVGARWDDHSGAPRLCPGGERIADNAAAGSRAAARATAPRTERWPTSSR